MPVQSGGSRKGYSSRYKCAENVLARTKASTLPWTEFVAGYQRCAVSRVSARGLRGCIREKRTHPPPPPSKLFEWYIAPWIEIKIHRLLSRFLRRFAIYAAVSRFVARFSVRYSRRDSPLFPFFPRIFCHFRFSRRKHDDAQTRGRQDTIQENSVCITSVNFISLGEPTRVPSFLLVPFSVCSPRHADMSCTREYARGAGISRGSQCIFMGLQVQIY